MRTQKSEEPKVCQTKRNEKQTPMDNETEKKHEVKN